MDPHVHHEFVQQSITELASSSEDLASIVTELAQIPAPTSLEEKRALRMVDLMRDAGLQDVRRDAAGNVVGDTPGTEAPDGSDVVLICAHLDCAYPEGTTIRLRREGPMLWGPGVGDDCAGLAVMLAAARAACAQPAGLRRPLMFAATTGEEGVGGLRGIRQLCTNLAGRLGEVVTVDGRLGALVTRAIAVKRYRITVRGPGGHSWADYGRPSAINGLAHIVEALGKIRPPAQPRTTINVGIIQGGSAVNAISAEASLQLDLRSECTASLRRIEQQALSCLKRAGTDLVVESSVIDERPSGECPDNCSLVRDAERALKGVGIFGRDMSGSTEANIPLSLGIPAIAFGPARVSDAHSPDERVEVSSLGPGAASLLALISLRAFNREP